MNLFLRLTILWVGASALLYLISWITYKGCKSTLTWGYWKRTVFTHILFQFIWYGGMMLWGFYLLIIFLLWYFPELNEIGM
nr:MAG TPA: hypothetical protein [Crassvirales sp.]